MFKPLPGLFHLDGIHIQGIDMALGLQPLQHPAGMAPVSQGGVQASLARLYLKELQYLIYHDRDMHTHRGASLLDDLCHGFRVLFRLELLIFFLVTFGMRSLVAHTALVLLAFLFHVFTLLCPFDILFQAPPSTWYPPL